MCRKLGPDWRDASLTFPGGARSAVVIVRAASGASVVAKMFPRPTALLTSILHHRYLRSRRLPVPELLSWSVHSRWAPPRRYIVFEACVPGTTLPDVPAAQRAQALRRIACTLGRLHAQTRRHHGWIGLPRPGAYARSYLRLAEERRRRLADLAREARLEDLGVLLRRAAARIGSRPRYELIHGHVNQFNFIVAEDQAVLIDLGSVHYGDAARDLVRALRRMCTSRADAELFLESYFAERGAGAREDYARAEPFYASDYLLRLTRKQADRSLREGSQTEDELRRKVEHCLDRCFALLRPEGPRFHETWDAT